MHHRKAALMHLSVLRPFPFFALLPGLALCVVVTLGAVFLEQAEVALFNGRWIESLVLAILLGVVTRSVFCLSDRFNPGIHFAAKTLLEAAVVLLGASLSVAAINETGVSLVAGTAALVTLSLAASFLMGRFFGLSVNLATLVACGNSICGNAAIAAAAPVIGAKPDDVAASIAFTALLGIGAVLILPLLHLLLGLSAVQYGVFSGLTAYAVPQVLAATASAGPVSTQIGTLVKLIRIMMLAPVIFGLSLVNSRRMGGRAIQFQHMLPWFIIGFFIMAALRSAGALPELALACFDNVGKVFTIMAMAALGLSVDIRSVAHAGGKVLWVAALSLFLLAAMSLALIAIIGIS